VKPDDQPLEFYEVEKAMHEYADQAEALSHAAAAVTDNSMQVGRRANFPVNRNPFLTDILDPIGIRVAEILKGDFTGHPFHGNQFRHLAGTAKGVLNRARNIAFILPNSVGKEGTIKEHRSVANGHRDLAASCRRAAAEATRAGKNHIALFWKSAADAHDNAATAHGAAAGAHVAFARAHPDQVRTILPQDPSVTRGMDQPTKDAIEMSKIATARTEKAVSYMQRNAA